MNDDLESQLRAALRPVVPRADFTDRVLASIPTASAASRRGRQWWGAGIAASLLVTLGVYSQVQRAHETAAGLQARKEVLQALRVTHQKLDLAYQSVKDHTAETS